MEFITSLSLLGWILIGLAALTLWQLPAILGTTVFMLTKGRGSGIKRDRAPGETYDGR